MKTAGTIRGLEPETTAEFDMELNFSCQKKVIEGFAGNGIKIIILACTDLQLLLPQHAQMEIHDTMKILADTTVREIVSI